MKKTLKLIGCLSLSLFSSCADDGQITNTNEVQKVVMSVEDFRFETLSRTTLTPTDDGATFRWEATDTVGIFPETGSQVAFPMISGAGTNTATFTGGGWALKASTPYMAYYPLQGKFYLDKAHIPVSYEGQTQSANASTEHLGSFDYMAASATTPSEGIVNFQFKHLGALVRLKIAMEETSTISSVTLQTDDEAFITNGLVDLTVTTPAITPTATSNSFPIILEDITVQEGEDLIVYFMLPPVDLANETLKVVVAKENGDSQEIALIGKNFEAGKPYGLSAVLEKEDVQNGIIITREDEEMTDDENEYVIENGEITEESVTNQ